MKMVKSLILGSAAGLVAMSGAQAADLPVKAKAVEYVKICSLYGAGFYYIPGTDTCIKLGGYLRADLGVNTNSIYGGNYTSPGSLGNRFTNAFTWRSREDLNIDTRTATEYGVVRTYFEGVFTWTDDSYTANNGTGNALGTTYSQIANGVGQANNGTSGGVATGALGVYFAFIQFAGFTIGKAISPFSAPWTNYPGNNYDALVGGGGTVTGVNQFIYTAQFGNGVSGTLGVQDPTQYYQAGVLNFGAFGSANGTGVNDYAGTVAPDIVGNINITQAWGLFQFSAAAHDNNPAYYSNAAIPGGVVQSGHPDDKWGFAVQAALSIANIPTGAGDVINVQGVYTDGATRYNIQDLAAGAGAATIFNGKGAPGTLGGVGLGVAPDSVFGLGGQQQLIQTWGGRGAYTHNWNPYWNTAIYGAYANIDYGTAGSSIFCASFTASNRGVTSCNPNYSITQAGIITRWTPVKNLTFSAEYVFSHLSQNNTGTIVTTGGNGNGVYTLANQDTHQVLLRAQRNF
jgi:hypothetical protein